MTSYEVNANGNRSFGGTAAAVASVAATWAKQGHEPKAYAILVGDTVRTVCVPVTTARATAAALKSAKA
jgi:hypothetical protein